jgi:mycothione reductase
VPARHHQLLIIGSGSANSIPDHRFAGHDVAIVEHGTFGGTCLNVGCIPTKMYVHTADLATQITHVGRLGLDASLTGVRWVDIRDRIFARIDPISEAGRHYRADGNTNVTLYEGHARFTGPRRILVEPVGGPAGDELAGGEPVELTAEQVVIGAGSRPVVPPEITSAGVPFHTSDTIMRIDRPPRHLLIVGGGYIAAEFAHVFAALGSAVTLVVRGETLLRGVEESIRRRFTALAMTRWDVRLRTEVSKAAGGPDGGVTLRVRDRHTGAEDEVGGDLLLVATGRRPNSDLLDAPATGITLDEAGRIPVDATQRTAAPGIWALGDVSSPYQLKHVANHEARTVAHNLLDPEHPIESDHRFVPSAVFTDPQLAGVGLTAQQCRERGIDHVTATREYAEVAFGWAMEDHAGCATVIAERGTGRLLGGHVMGEQASTLIQPLILALNQGLTAHQAATGQYWIHPALTEVVENALLEAATAAAARSGS